MRRTTRLLAAPPNLLAVCGFVCVALSLFFLSIGTVQPPPLQAAAGASSHSNGQAAAAAAVCPLPDCPLPDANLRCVPQHVGNGGMGVMPSAHIEQVRIDTGQRFYGVFDDLLLFTGLAEPELRRRLERVAQFHFEGEHAWWGPTTTSELAWFYRTSASYLFANAIHPDVTADLGLTVDDGPVLDYSGGVGNNVLALAQRGIQVVYFGIGLQEFEFARFRVEAKGLQHLVQFVRPFVRNNVTGVLEFNARTAVPNLQFGAILAFDVLEHIPDYHITLAHLIALLRPGGRIFENSPFGGEDDPVAVHQKASMPLSEAMVGMTRQSHKVCSVWTKVESAQ